MGGDAQGKKDPGAVMTFCAGGFAGMANWAAMMPIDTVKSKYQVRSNGMVLRC